MAKARRKRTRTRKRSKAGWAGDPQVPISPMWLRAVLAECGVTVAELWRRVGGNEQTLAYLTKGEKLKKTRASRFAAIAAALNVAEPLLAGEASFMPHGHHEGYDGVFSARAWLASQRLLTRAHNALQRDAEARREGSVWAGKSDAAWSALNTILLQLTRLDHWRGRLLHNAVPRTDQTSPESDAASLALIQFLEYALSPWLAGTAALNYAALDLLEFTARANFAGDPTEPNAVLTNHPVHSYQLEILP